MLNKAGKKKYIWMVICFSLAFIIGIVTVLMCVLPKGEKEKNIEITEIFYDSNNASDVENSKISRKSETSVNCKIVLGSEIESSITYSIKINNQTNYNYYFDGVKYDGAENYSNEDISFEVNELKRYDVVKSKSSIVLKITFSYLGTIVPENKTLVAVLDFKFERTKELNELIKLDNTLITTDPTLTDVSNNTTDFNGLYKKRWQ